MPIYFYPFIIFVLLAFYLDSKNKRIPNWLNVSGAGVALLFHLITDGTSGIIFSILGLLVGFGCLLLLYLFKAVGAGDVKLFGALGAFVGTEFVLTTLLYSVIYAGVIGLAMLLIRKEFFTRMTRLFFALFELKSTKNKEVMEDYKQASLHFPFMYAVVPGILTAYYYVLL